MSHPNAIDYSEVVRKWGIDKNIGEFKSQSMENVSHSIKIIFCLQNTDFIVILNFLGF